MEGLLTLGFPLILTAKGMAFCVLGAMAGTLLGFVLGVGPLAVVMLMFSMRGGQADGLALLGGLFYGAQYGRSVAAILLGVPGGPSAIVSARDGHPLADRGEAVRALGIVLAASFFACTIATLVIAALGNPLSGIALLIGPADYVALLVLALAIGIAMSGATLPGSVTMAAAGVGLAYFDLALTDGRLTMPFAPDAWKDGFSGYAIALGLICFSAAFAQLRAEVEVDRPIVSTRAVRVSAEDLRQTAFPILRGSVTGAVMGLLPVGAVLAPFLAYRLEQTLAGGDGRFGTGAIEGVAAPEAANNAAAQASLLPALTLGFQNDTVMGLLVGALTLSRAVPGPELLGKSPGLYWGAIAAFWMGSLAVLCIGLATTGVWARVGRLPRRYVLWTMVLLGCIWAYAQDGQIVDVVVALAFGFAGHFIMGRGLAPMPMLIGFLVGRQLDGHLRSALMVSRGNLMTLLDHPLSAGLLLVACLALTASFWSWCRQRGGAGNGGLRPKSHKEVPGRP